MGAKIQGSRHARTGLPKFEQTYPLQITFLIRKLYLERNESICPISRKQPRRRYGGAQNRYGESGKHGMEQNIFQQVTAGGYLPADRTVLAGAVMPRFHRDKHKRAQHNERHNKCRKHFHVYLFERHASLSFSKNYFAVFGMMRHSHLTEPMMNRQSRAAAPAPWI